MNFDDFDARMRIYETAHDHCVLPGMYIVARLDGRGFTRLTKELLTLEAPFDVRFRDMMVGTVEHLMNCGFSVVYGYTQSDEISLLFRLDEGAFGRKERKFNSILAGEASASLSLQTGRVVAFDCRVCQLPSIDLVVDYFLWRQEDAHRNALNAHCYWMLRKEGQSVAAATQALSGISVADKNELLFSRGINFNELPAWQKRGTGMFWQEYEKLGFNPVTGETVPAVRRRIQPEYTLPLKDEYGELIRRLLSAAL